MTAPNDAFRQFQQELAALEQPKGPPPTRLDLAKADFLAVKRRYGLTVADVVTFFPEEEGIAYLQQLIAARER